MTAVCKVCGEDCHCAHGKRQCCDDDKEDPFFCAECSAVLDDALALVGDLVTCEHDVTTVIPGALDALWCSGCGSIRMNGTWVASAARSLAVEIDQDAIEARLIERVSFGGPPKPPPSALN